MAFAGPAPETINGRLAMVGVIGAIFAEFATGLSVSQQFWTYPVRARGLPHGCGAFSRVSLPFLPPPSPP